MGMKIGGQEQSSGIMKWLKALAQKANGMVVQDGKALKNKEDATNKTLDKAFEPPKTENSDNAIYR